MLIFIATRGACTWTPCSKTASSYSRFLVEICTSVVDCSGVLDVDPDTAQTFQRPQATQSDMHHFL